MNTLEGYIPVSYTHLASEGGISVIPENPNALAEAILKLLENPDLSIKMGSKGLRYVTKNCSWYSVAKQVDSCLLYTSFSK